MLTVPPLTVVPTLFLGPWNKLCYETNYVKQIMCTPSYHFLHTKTIIWSLLANLTSNFGTIFTLFSAIILKLKHPCQNGLRTQCCIYLWAVLFVSLVLSALLLSPLLISVSTRLVYPSFLSLVVSLLCLFVFATSTNENVFIHLQFLFKLYIFLVFYNTS